MKQLVRKPFLLTLILSLPLWIAVGNYIVAFCLGLFVAFLISMIDSIIAVQRQQRQPDQHRSENTSDPHP